MMVLSMQRIFSDSVGEEYSTAASIVISSLRSMRNLRLFIPKPFGK